MRFVVYVPRENIGIDRGSGIVGRVMDSAEMPDQGRMVELYYEGNRYGYANVVTFADRVRIAADRMKTRYPTIAHAIVHVSRVVRIGEYDDELGRVELDPGAAAALRVWLGFGEDEPTENELGHKAATRRGW